MHVRCKHLYISSLRNNIVNDQVLRRSTTAIFSYSVLELIAAVTSLSSVLDRSAY